jgi:hypothetical protein
MTCTHSEKELAHQIEIALNHRAGRQVHGLHVILRNGGVILRGRSSTYYAKQLAQHLAVALIGWPVVANEIQVT